MSTKKENNLFFGTKGFKERYSVGYSTQALWRDKGMPYYRVQGSKKILYRDKEVLTWITSQRNEILDDPQQNILTTKTKK